METIMMYYFFMEFDVGFILVGRGLDQNMIIFQNLDKIGYIPN